MTPLIGLLIIALNPGLAPQAPRDNPISGRPAAAALRAEGLITRQPIGASIRGVVVDSQGATVEGAAVVAKNNKTGLETRAQTNDKGSFIISPLPPGIYSLTVTSKEFLPDQRQVEVTTGISPPLRIEVKSGAARTTMLPVTAVPRARTEGSPGQPQQLTQKEPTKQVEGQLESLKTGLIVFNPPTSMQTGKNETVEVRVSKSLLKDLTKGLQGSGATQNQPIQVGSEMGVTLKGTGGYFTIALLNSDEKQVITDNEFTQWLFDVLPLKAGSATLNLTAYVVLDTADGPEQHDYPVFTRQIEVVTVPKSVVAAVLGWIGGNWDKLLAALVSTGLLGWFVTRLKKTGKSNDKS